MEAKIEKPEMPVQTEQVDPFITYGRGKKEPWDMTPEEEAAAAEEIHIRVRKNAFAHNLPVYFGRDGYVCAEYSDGTIVRLKPIESSLNG